jgi:hypothetical protein
MAKLYSVGQSKVKTYRSCRQQYHFKYEEGLQRKRTKRPFVFGRIVHRMIEAKAQGEDPMQILKEIEIDNLPIFTAEKEMYGEIITDIAVIMTDYFEFWEKVRPDGLRFIPVEDENDELRFAEHEFDVPLSALVRKRDRTRTEGIVFKGQVDGLGKTPNKLRWLVEHKSFDKMPGDDERWRNLQSVVYIRAVLHLGWMKQIDGVAWNYIMSKAPTIPQLLKDGTRLSKQAIITLPSVVRSVLKVHKLDPKLEHHKILLQRAEEARREYFQRIYAPVNQTTADNIFDGFVETAIEMRENAGKKKDKNIGRHCSWCDYEPLCRTELTGGDVEFVRKGEFVEEDPEAYRRTQRTNKFNAAK